LLLLARSGLKRARKLFVGIHEDGNTLEFKEKKGSDPGIGSGMIYGSGRAHHILVPYVDEGLNLYDYYIIIMSSNVFNDEGLNLYDYHVIGR
jgi:hypothetical protein